VTTHLKRDSFHMRHDLLSSNIMMNRPSFFPRCVRQSIVIFIIMKNQRLSDNRFLTCRNDFSSRAPESEPEEAEPQSERDLEHSTRSGLIGIIQFTPPMWYVDWLQSWTGASNSWEPASEAEEPVWNHWTRTLNGDEVKQRLGDEQCKDYLWFTDW